MQTVAEICICMMGSLIVTLLAASIFPGQPSVMYYGLGSYIIGALVLVILRVVQRP